MCATPTTCSTKSVCRSRPTHRADMKSLIGPPLIRFYHTFMKIRKFLALASLALLPLCSMQAKTHTADEGKMNQFIDDLMAKMTLQEKIGQLNLSVTGTIVTGQAKSSDIAGKITRGEVGGLFNLKGVKNIRDMQKIAVEQSRLKIPLLFGMDVIHGYETVFPIPFSLSCSWDMQAIKRSAQIAAQEASADGLNWTFSPMLDICVDPRWGRMAEGSGEDPYLGSQVARAMVEGYQGTDLSAPNTVMACIKHFALYGGSEAGRDYNTVDMSRWRMFNYYMPPYKAAVDAGAMSVMTSFNTVEGVPSTANRWLLTDVLRGMWGFKGMVVTDYTAIAEMMDHGLGDLKTVSALALNAGTDMDMMSDGYRGTLAQSIAEGKVSEAAVNAACRRVLEAKWKLGLFADPYRYCNEKRAKKEAVGDKAEVLYARGSNFMHDTKLEANAGIYERDKRSDKEILDEAIAVSRNADVIVAAVGESSEMSGECCSRSSLDMPDAQRDMLAALKKLGKPIVLLNFSGRPTVMTWENDNFDAILNVWFGGCETADAICDVLFGDKCPSGKLTATMPKSVGQIPLYYNHLNTGRPLEEGKWFSKFRSNYLDIDNDPLFPFGYGLSYVTFSYGKPRLSSDTLTMGGSLTLTVDVTNTGDRDADEVVQLYVRDLVGSLSRPVKELKGFKRINLKKGETKTVSFTVTPDDLMFYNQQLEYKCEPGDSNIMVGPNSRDVQTLKFSLK